MHKIGLFVMPGFQSMCFGALSAFEVANLKTIEPFYEIHVVSEHGGLVRSSINMEVTTKPIMSCNPDTILIAIGWEYPAVSAEMRGYLKEVAQSGKRLVALCLGALVLGEAGLLNGRRVNTHWKFAVDLQKRFPLSRVEMDRLFINDGPVWSSAGMASGIDLALAVIESDHGRDIAHATAKGLVIHHRRAGGQSQSSSLLDLDAQTDRIQTALSYAKRNLNKPLNNEELARRLA